jgi:hypothetical protein
MGKVALARKVAVILHRIWIDGTTYRSAVDGDAGMIEGITSTAVLPVARSMNTSNASWRGGPTHCSEGQR